MKNIIPKIIGALQIIGGLYGSILFINDRYFALIPVLFIIFNLLAGILLIIKEKIGTPISLLVLAPQIIHVYADQSTMFDFATPVSFGFLFKPEFEIGLYESHGFSALYGQGLPSSIQINLLAIAGFIYLWKQLNKTAEPVN